MLTKLATATRRARDRPAREEIEPAAVELLRRHGPQILSTARRYAASPEDAEDAYQRGLEILLTKAPSTRADDLVPWLKTVVKHEAFALRKQRERQGLPTGYEPDEATAVDTHEQVERLDRLHQGAEALRRLKPQEIRCILLLAEGHSYKQIQEITGFSYTKVNRCLSEGRRSFQRRLEGIETGAECERLAPLVAALAEGSAGADDMALLRPHLRTCISCRSALRDAREPSARVAAFAPIALLFGGVRSAFDWAGAHKLVAAAASAAAISGGGIAAVEATQHQPPRVRHPQHVLRRPAAIKAVPMRRVAPRPPGVKHVRVRAETKTPKPAPRPSREFDIAPAIRAPAPGRPPKQPRPAPPPPQTGEFGP